MIKRFFIVLSWCLLAAPGAHAQSGDARSNEIFMFVGEVKILPVKDVSRIAVGNGKLFTTSVIDNNQMLVIAEAPGDSSLVIWTGDNRTAAYTVRISPRDAGDTYRGVTAMLKDIPGIQVTPVGANVIISGTTSKENLARIGAAIRSYPQATSMVREEEVAMRRMVYMKVQIIEMKRSVLENLGMQWPGSFAGPMVGFAGNLGADTPQTQGALRGVLPMPNSGLATYLGVSTLINTTINLAKNNGDAYTLAEPELSARSGGEAKFLAGGQIPLPAVSSTGAGSVEFKDYGVRLSINPIADDQGNIIATVKTEISSIDPTVSVQGIPGFLTRQSESEINVKNGQTIVMSGLVNTEMSNDATRVPGISNLPVLGRLFRSDNFRTGRTDLVVLVTPTVVDPASTITRERIEKGMDIRERFERQLSNQDIID